MRRNSIQWIAILLAILPALLLAGNFVANGPGANPIETITHLTGEWGLRFILLSLAITPARRWLGVPRIGPLRRTFGLVGFTYACLHLFTWALLDLGLDLPSILEDLTERPYVMAGMSAWSLLFVLALTSTRRAMARLGRRWTRLHRMVYVAALLGVIHHFWLTKADYRPAIVHGTILALLLAARLAWTVRNRRESTQTSLKSLTGR